MFATAVIAGTQGAKQTSNLIPFCHPLGLEGCHITIEVHGDQCIVDCIATITGKTGVEMEALTGTQPRPGEGKAGAGERE